MPEWIDPLADHSTEKELRKVAETAMDFAFHIWNTERRQVRDHFLKLRNSYNGLIEEERIRHINSQYGVNLRVKYVDYRITRNKLDTLCGEFLQRPLRTTVYLSNKEALLKRQERHNYLTGVMHAQKEIERLRSMGVDPLDGMEIPTTEKEVDEIVSRESLQAETLMQAGVEDEIKKRRLKEKLAKCIKDLGLTGECFARNYIDEYGYTVTEKILPENAIFMELEGDDYLERTPFFGQRYQWTMNEILSAFEFNKKDPDQERELEEIKNCFSNNDNYNETWSPHMGYNKSGRYCMNVYHLEWMMLDPYYLKITVDPETGERKVIQFSEDYYKRKKDTQIKQDLANGLYELEIRYKETRYECYRIGADIFRKIRKAPNQPVKTDDPFPSIFTYTGLLFNTENCERVSLYEALEEIKHLHNIAMFQIRREIYKIKGSAVTYNRAFLPRDGKGKLVKFGEILGKLINDGVYDYNTYSEGNLAGKDIDITNAIQVLDLGASRSLPMLMQLVIQIENMIDKIGTINDNRQGGTKASETATNAQANIFMSRTMTEPLFYQFDRFVENVVMRIVEHNKIAWQLRPERALQMVGPTGMADVELIKELRWQDSTVIVLDTRREMQIRDILNRMIEQGVSSKELPIDYAGKAMISETLGEMQTALIDGRAALLAAMSAQREEEGRIKEQLEGKMIMREAQLDAREHEQEKELILLKAGNAAAQSSQKTKDKVLLNQQQADLKTQ